jgi:type II secretory pathway pseudopilin PulG
MIRRRKRPAYTLLEIILALAIAILLLAALYSAVGFQLRQAQTGRDVTSQTTLSRSIVARIESDVASSLALADPARFRNQSTNAQAQQAQQSAQGTSGQAASGQGTSGTASSAKGSSGTAAGGSNSSGAGGTNNSGMLPTAQPADATDDSNGMTGDNGPVVLPCGVMGDSTSLTLFVSKVPGELYGTRGGDGQLVSDLRKIHYWLADGGQGLCRQEIRVATTADALSLDPPSGDVNNYLLAPEVKSIAFRYFDGTSQTWMDSWDSTTLGDDTVTPIGAPRAIEVRVGVLPPGGKDGDELKYYRHTIAILTSNGTTQATNPGQ